MANSQQSIKRVRQAITRRMHNVSLISKMRTSIKEVHKALEVKDKESVVLKFKEAQSNLDSMARKGLIHPNKSARTKSRLNKKVKELVLS